MKPDNDATGSVPDQLAGYRVVGILGEGGSGTVYEAYADQRPIALKVLRADQAPTGRERQRWIKEAEHLASIRHPGVVQVLGLGELDDGRPYLAMEHLHGASLAERIARGRLELGHALLVFDQIAAAVQAIHDAGLIHRDLKPENVMLVDNDRRAVLLDLGIARPAEAPPSTTTQAGYQRGTPAVMAPERFFGERATVRSDIYELAVIFFVMVTGGLPWREVLDAKQRLNPLTPSQVGVTLPAGMEDALMRALATEADQRPASVRELADQVRTAGWGGATEPAVTPTPRPEQAATTDTRPHGSQWLPRVLLVAAVLLFGGGLTAALLADRGDDRDDAPRKTAAAPPVALPPAEIQVESIAADAGAIAVAAPPDAAVAAAEEEAVAIAAPAQAKPKPPAARKTPPPAKKKPAVAASKLPPPAAGATTMTWCRKQFSLYCTAEFKATEGAMAGELCKRMTEQLVTWEQMPPQAAASIEDTCKKNYPTSAKAVETRLEMYRQMMSGKAP